MTSFLYRNVRRLSMLGRKWRDAHSVRRGL